MKIRREKNLEVFCRDTALQPWVERSRRRVNERYKTACDGFMTTKILNCASPDSD